MTSPRRLASVLSGALAALLTFAGTSALSAPPAAAVDTAAYIALAAKPAQAAQKELGVPASVTIAQSIIESGWGRSGLTTKYNNYFGIKCVAVVSPYQKGCVRLPSYEYYGPGNKPVLQVSGFRTYASMEMSFKDHGYLLSSLSRYRKAFDYKDDPDQFIREVHKAGYATDKTYAQMIIGVMKQYNLYRYDVAAPAPAPEPPAPADPTVARNLAFISSVVSAAQQAQLSWNVPTPVSIAIAAQSTKWGTLASLKDTRNYFGLTCGAKNTQFQLGCKTYSSTAKVNGKTVKTTLKLRTYDSVARSFADFAAELSNSSKYAAAKKFPAWPETYLKTLMKAGYANDAAYAEVLRNLQAYNLYVYDVPFPTIQVNAVDFRVTAIQHLLIHKGAKLTLTGKLDAATVAALKAFQTKQTLPVSGLADPRTLLALTSGFNAKTTNHQVTAVQVLLTGKGWPLPAIGIFGPRTTKATLEFQAKYRAGVNAVVTSVTWAKLLA